MNAAHVTSTAALDDLLGELAASAASPAQDPAVREQFEQLLATRPAALLRSGGPVHLTASCHIVDAPGEHVVLLWHRKGRFWVQPGGHLEPGEDSFEQAARREAEEETGLAGLTRVSAGPAMLHQHALADGFGACRAHWDVQYLLRAPGPAAEVPLRGSEESGEVVWAPLATLPEGTVADIPITLRRLAPLLAPARR